MNHRKLIEIELKKHNIMLEKPNKNSTSTTNTSTCSFKKKSINTKDLLTKIEDYHKTSKKRIEIVTNYLQRTLKQNYILAQNFTMDAN